jgi:hypothetical protein
MAYVTGALIREDLVSDMNPLDVRFLFSPLGDGCMVRISLLAS